ncbi:Uma2 family endonuclease [Chloroflexi bacterium TSY]|nr:Uma2 family endonuclease [Chloroflexi bacterium TSY]
MTNVRTDMFIEFDEEIAPEELAELGSYNHSYLQAKLSALFFLMDEYVALTELSLDISTLDDEALLAKYRDSIKPDVSVYSKRTPDLVDDILKMVEMPLLTIEILSPMQGVQTLIDKVKVYFALGVQSCWLVYPSVRTVAVYTSPKTFLSYNDGDIIDEILDIRLPVSQIFS